MGFKQYLDSLKLSSEEAIADGEKDSLSGLKQYLHIQRSAEKDLNIIIQTAYESSQSQLILLLGNVGDGKSHMLAKMWEILPAEMSTFIVQNDATESNSKNKTYLDNLFEIFEPYSDTNLEKQEQTIKTIIAINLGTITNFLEVAGKGFSQLKRYVDENYLIDSNLQINSVKRITHFASLNLTDYHIYSLESTGAKTQVFLDILTKITQKSQGNPFVDAYNDYYSQHPQPECCPIKYNFDLLSQDKVQGTISDLLVKVIISENLIISVRLLMNWIYDLIVPPEFANLSEEEVFRATTRPMNGGKFYSQILPSLLFSSGSTSPLLKAIKKYEPISDNGTVDQFVIKLGTIAEAKDYFVKYNVLQQEDSLYTILDQLDTADRIKLFLRLHYILKIQDDLNQNDIVFQDFLQNLYNFNVGNNRYLITLYKNVQNAIYLWNGRPGEATGYINSNIGRKQAVYNISQKLELEDAPSKILTEVIPTLEKFSKVLIVSYKVQNESNVFSLEVDYNLFNLISKINNGYRPNKVDKATHIKFTQFVNKLSSYKSETKELLIQQFSGESLKKFALTYSSGFDDFNFIDK
jgi:DNA phosphorothioation-dependent restriction protein DptF